jgi:hypothetical protein
MTIPISGKKTVTNAGTAEALGAQQVVGPLAIKALSTNTGLVYVGNDGAGDVASTNGFELAAGDVIVLDFNGNLANVMVDAAVNGEGVTGCGTKFRGKVVR